MPIKAKNIGADFVNNTPLVEQIEQSVALQQSTDDMMSDIISERTKMKNTMVLSMLGALTPVTYYQTVADSSNNYATDANGSSDIAFNTKKFIEIKDFRVHLTNTTNLQNENSEEEKSYITNGALDILPRTIKPNIGDYFIMVYYGRKMCYQISSVEVESYEQDSGFKCEYVLYKQDYTVPEKQISEHKLYRHEMLAGTYRPILSSNELEILQKLQKLYNHLSSVFNRLFYDKTIDGYMYKNYDKEKDKYQIKDNININTLGKRGGIFRADYSGDSMSHINAPRKIKIEDMVYDNLLNCFISKNRIFRNFDGLMLSVQPLLGKDVVGYKRSVFGCIEDMSVANYKNIFVIPEAIDILTPEVNSYLVGKRNAIHCDQMDVYTQNCLEFHEFFPESLMNQLINGKSSDLHMRCTDKMYNSIDSMMIETIVRYVYKSRDDFTERFLYLYENIDNLYEHNISYVNIFYLFPIIGYILERTLEELFSDNIIS